MASIKASAVSYLNTKPFLIGLEKTGLLDSLDLSLDIPAITAQKLLQGKVDLALVPVAILPQLPTYHLISNYCIGTTGTVKTVALYSQVPLSEITEIFLDYHSRTSVQLVQVLSTYHWQLSNIRFRPAQKGFESGLLGTKAGVIIGDRTMIYDDKFKYKYDLGDAWLAHTQLPFVFAAWVSTVRLPQTFIEKLNKAFALGMQSIDEVVAQYRDSYPIHFNIKTYLTEHISYTLDAQKRAGLSLFLQYLREMSSVKTNVLASS